MWYDERKIIREDVMVAVISVIGRDSVGIIADVSAKCREYHANIVDISQTVLQNYFAMIMLVEIDQLTASFGDFIDAMDKLGKAKQLSIHTMHEDVFNAMHKI